VVAGLEEIRLALLRLGNGTSSVESITQELAESHSLTECLDDGFGRLPT
jgi:hypothetical protein